MWTQITEELKTVQVHQQEVPQVELAIYLNQYENFTYKGFIEKQKVGNMQLLIETVKGLINEEIPEEQRGKIDIFYKAKDRFLPAIESDSQCNQEYGQFINQLPNKSALSIKVEYQK